jgi:hypothetical protein
MDGLKRSGLKRWQKRLTRNRRGNRTALARLHLLNQGRSLRAPAMDA